MLAVDVPSGVNADTGAYCWGYNGHGQLGEGSTNPRYAPAVVVQ